MNGLIRFLSLFLVLFTAIYAWRKTHPAKVVEPPIAAIAAAIPAPKVPEPAVSIAPPTAPIADEIVTTAPPPNGTPHPSASTQQTSSTTRTWTNRDGRTIQADYISASKTSVTVRRSDDTVFVIPLANLADTDVQWVAARQPRPLAITQQQLDKLAQRFPSVPTLQNGEITNDILQLHDKYKGMVKFIRPATVEPNLRMIRSKIADDIQKLTQVAKTTPGDGTGKRGSLQSAAAENGVLSARKSLVWLQGSLTTYLDSYESLNAAKE